ncbi:MAG: dihydrolipoamide acetyltransferase family protein [Thermodesulfobacteriota bacterium]
MISEILVPKLGMSQAEVTVIQWLAGDGDRLEAGRTVVIIETAKVSYEVPSPASGFVFRLKQVKEKARIGEALGVVADRLEELENYAGRKSSRAAKASPGGLFDDEDDISGPGPSLSFEDRDVSAGSGRAGGRTAQVAPASTYSWPPLDLANRRIQKRLPFLGMRRTIADNLMASLHGGAQLTIITQADVTELGRLRDELKLDRPDVGVTFVDMIVKASSAVLREYPIVNSALDHDEIVIWDEVNLGVAVALDQGLVVPVVRDADKKSLFAVSREIKKLSQKAREGQLAPDDFRGGTFTVSSGGKVEVDIITPIINPPENAILGLGKIGPAPAIHQGHLTIRTMTHLCLTFDHRIIDGVPAGLFLTRLKEIIQTPALFRKILR